MSYQGNLSPLNMLFLQAILCFSLLNVCCVNARRIEPSYPSNVTGWQGKPGKSRTFVLKKGESTDNGIIQVKVVEIYPPKFFADVGSFERQARAKIQFIRVSDQKLLCEDIYPEHGGALLWPESCNSNDSEFSLLRDNKITSLSVIGINLKEEWVYFGM